MADDHPGTAKRLKGKLINHFTPDMETRKFIVRGYAPFYGKEANHFLKACDMGIEGFFVPKMMEVTAHLESGVTPEQCAQQPEAIHRAFAEMGWQEITVVYDDTPSRPKEL